MAEQDSGNKTYAPPIYHEFMDSAFKVSDKVELVTPARFLFDAGSTPKAWNRKMLNDPHFKVMSYKADASSAFRIPTSRAVLPLPIEMLIGISVR